MNGLLFTTKICPRCPAAKQYLSKFNNIEHIDAQENTALTKKYGIRTVPSLVLLDNEELKQILNYTDIMNFKGEGL
jgi:ribonucleoside-triphosphate reductase (formate)